MRTRLANVLLLAALVLAVTRLWQFIGEPPPMLPTITAGATGPAATAGNREQKVEVAESRPATYDVIVARDLFSSTRGIVTPAATAMINPAPKPQPVPKLTLYGVVIIDGEKTAYIQEGTQEGRPRKVRENESFAGGVVNTIRPDGVIFFFAGSEINVPLRTPKVGAEAPSPRGQESGSAAPRSQPPAAFPRRQTPTDSPPGLVPAPSHQMTSVPGMPTVPPGMQSVAPPVEPGGEIFGAEEFPEGSMPGGAAPGFPEEEAAE